ncbi:hypothetical protein M407DRAFT_234488 [Tulasnella calospora MUT 4182]|uniref:Calpain catalytic domain-containing protein n=1 Tax=Tulasnella calospora MUT 4182 TaxID=1051891 RepID=A0A0C3MI31_9AGAM|nr:hypothetical protein M407DRAFT_234488 [Tulasnella calospora MUT 4182]
MAPDGTLNFQEAEAALAKAAVKASQQDFDAAYDLYVRAAKAFLHLARATASSNSGTRVQSTLLSARCRENAAKALERAEQIKARRSAPTSQSAMETIAFKRRWAHTYLEDQLAVLDRSTRVNGHKFDPWEARHESIGPIANPPFKDPDGALTLSQSQAELFASWWRACESKDESSIMTTPNLATEDIYQHIVTNCSVIAGLAVCWEHNLRFGTNLCLSSIYPQHDDGTAQFRSDGMYSVRLLLNGTHRQAIIDDTLPATDGGLLLCASTRGTRVLWPSIIEKAYMKVMGGYDFPGSNPANDLHAIIGWIPEDIDLHGSGFQEEGTWRRVYEGFKTGQCLVTLGTGEALRMASAGPNLVPLHGYSVIGMSNLGTNGQSIMNPWITSGGGSVPNPSSRMFSRGVDSQAKFDGLLIGSLWMEWNEVCEAFDGLYLNWDPSPFKNTRSFHGWAHNGILWIKCTKFAIDPTNQSSGDDNYSEMWFLLTRHVVSKDHPSEFISLDTASRGGQIDPLAEDLLSRQSGYTNSTHVLVCSHLVNQNHPSMRSAFLSRSANRPVAFTLTVFSQTAINLMEHPRKLPFSAQVDGTFTSRTSGGNPTYRTFMHNPQYRLRLQPGVVQGSKTLRMILEATKNVAIKATIVWGGGKRVTELTQGDVQMDSGPYVYGTTAVGGLLKPSDYTLILSTFTPGQQSPYSISVEADGPVSLEAIPSEGAGMFTKSVKGKWCGSSAAGNPSFGRYHHNPHFDIQVAQATTLFCRLQHVDAPSGTAINLTIFRKDDAGQIKEQVVTSGSYADAVCGVATSPFQLQGPAVYSAIVSTFDPGVEAGFELTAYSSACPVSLSASELN